MTVLAWNALDPTATPGVSAAGGEQLAMLAAEPETTDHAEQEALQRAAAEREARQRAAAEQEALQKAEAERQAMERAAVAAREAARKATELAAAEAASRRATQLAATKVNETAKPAPRTAKPTPSRPDIEVISELINEFERAFESRDLRRLERTANLSQGKRELLRQVFRNYSVIEVSISDLALLGGQGSASATMTVTKLLDHDGNRVIPGAWKDQQLVTRKRVGEWQKFEW